MSYIYKYLPPERKTYLIDGLLRFTPPSDLNDPYECLPALPIEVEQAAFNYVKREILTPPKHQAGMSRIERRLADKIYKKHAQKVMKEINMDPSFIRKKFYDDAKAKIDGNIGILSLSRRWDSALMWSHYATSHSGLCIGFNREHDFFKQDNDKNDNGNFIFKPVIYSKQRSLVPSNRLNKSQSISVLCTKSIDWQYEQEERAIALLSDATKTINIEQLKLSLFRVPHDAIAEIIIGMRASNNIEGLATDLAKKLSIPLYRTEISMHSFDVERKPINY
ncbi:DUF2971 domain-containing protein [Aeromonas dhakensis]|uniref:DUF2971 domain-containing protein n=1 Tax=Aeromonas dhakensis TaxID=196024 RepID=UPI001F609FD1|nr:DUF2971 domain-containing protein [Aeromonas dhakensis]UNU87541.1 DUF2971 domain-containing protein [Aeromonas dhakensis]